MLVSVVAPMTVYKSFARCCVPFAEATALPNLVVATAKERDFAARVHSCTITSNLLKAGEGTYFMGDVHYGFTSSLEEEDKRTAMLCIPPHYRRLWDKIQELRGNLNCKGFIVLGNPGIGKSHFCVYAAVRYAAFA